MAKELNAVPSEANSWPPCPTGLAEALGLDASFGSHSYAEDSPS